MYRPRTVSGKLEIHLSTMIENVRRLRIALAAANSEKRRIDLCHEIRLSQVQANTIAEVLEVQKPFV